MPVIAGFITVPTGERSEVSINVREIASFESHVVTSYSYVDYTLVTLKSGVQHDCRISADKFRKLVQEASSVLTGSDV